MRERAPARDLVRRILQVVDDAGGSRAVEVRLRVGMLSHPTPTALTEALEAHAAGTAAEGVRVVVETGGELTAEDALKARLVAVVVAG